MTGVLGHAPPPPRPAAVTAGRLFVFLLSLSVALAAWTLSFIMSVFTAEEVMHAAISAMLHFFFAAVLAYLVTRAFTAKLAYGWSAAILALAACIPICVVLFYGMLMSLNMG